MLTRQGWIVVGLAGGLVVGGRILGTFELMVLGTIAGVLVLLAALTTGLTRVAFDVRRELRPPRLHAGGTARVGLQVTNLGSRRTPPVEMTDSVDHRRDRWLTLPPLDPDETVELSYELTTHRRGVIAVGPLRVLFSDPFGLTRLVVDAHDATELTVFPRVDPIGAIDPSRRGDPLGGVRSADAMGRSGDEFYALRPYVVGDDMRRVHWPSSARLDELMVRQDVVPLQQRTTVLADLRDSTTDADSFEAVVSAAASVVVRAAADQDRVRLVTSDAGDAGMGGSHHHVEALLEHLAVVGPLPAERWDATVARLARSREGGTLVVLTAGGDDPLRLEAIGSRYERIVVVRVGERPFPEAWASALDAVVPG